MAVVAGRPFQVPLGTNEYDDVRIAGHEAIPRRDTIAEHRRDRCAKFAVSSLRCLFVFVSRASFFFFIVVSVVRRTCLASTPGKQRLPMSSQDTMFD